MWSTKLQTDSWVNVRLGDNADWLRVSQIQRVSSVPNATGSNVHLITGQTVYSDYKASELVKLFGAEEANDE